MTENDPTFLAAALEHAEGERDKVADDLAKIQAKYPGSEKVASAEAALAAAEEAVAEAEAALNTARAAAPDILSETGAAAFDATISTT